jgi:hypothetical protein
MEAVDDEGVLSERVGFTPHLPSAWWISIYGKTRIIEQHYRAVLSMVQKAGGLLQLPFQVMLRAL